MNKIQIQQDALEFPPEDRLELADTLYRSLDPPPLADWQGELLRKRVAEADAHPERFSSWEEAKQRLEQGIRRPRSGA
jgi:putative addiction module component (TIGR02574 family)